MGRLRRRAALARRRGAACRHRHEPARPFRRRAAALAPRIQSEKHGITLLMSHFACAETRSIRSTASRSRCSARVRMLFRGVAPRSPIHPASFLSDKRALRSGAAGRRALWRQPDARASPTRCARWSSSRPASCKCAPGERATPSATAPTGRRGAPPRIAIVAVGYGDGYLRAAGASEEKAGRRRRSSAASAARSPAGCPWT